MNEQQEYLIPKKEMAPEPENLLKFLLIAWCKDRNKE